MGLSGAAPDAAAAPPGAARAGELELEPELDDDREPAAAEPAAAAAAAGAPLRLQLATSRKGARTRSTALVLTTAERLLGIASDPRPVLVQPAQRAFTAPQQGSHPQKAAVASDNDIELMRVALAAEDEDHERRKARIKKRFRAKMKRSDAKTSKRRADSSKRQHREPVAAARVPEGGVVSPPAAQGDAVRRKPTPTETVAAFFTVLPQVLEWPETERRKATAAHKAVIEVHLSWSSYLRWALRARTFSSLLPPCRYYGRWQAGVLQEDTDRPDGRPPLIDSRYLEELKRTVSERETSSGECTFWASICMLG